MKRPVVFITHDPAALANYYGPRALSSLEAIADVRTSARDTFWDVDSLSDAAREADFIVSDRRTEGSAVLLELLPRLLGFCRCAVDIRNVDVAAASRLGIVVTRASAGFMASVSEWIIAAMIDLSRGISNAAALYRAGSMPGVAMGRELRGSTLGIIGYGQIARYLAPIGIALGMRVVACDPHRPIDDPRVGQVSQHDLLAQSDYVVCLATATPETENLMNGDAFAAMKPTAFFVNASRGNLVDEDALLHALDDRTIAGCALDVGRAPDQMPSVELARHPRVIATPHIGGLTPQAIEHQSMETVRQVEALARGELPIGVVNAEHANRWRAWIGPRS